MKQIITIILFCNSILLLNAQNNISLSLSKQEIKGKNYVSITIKNSNPYNVIIFPYATWGGSETQYMYLPKSYLILIGNPSESNRKESDRIILLDESQLSSLEKAPTSLLIKAGEVHTAKYLLFGETHIPYKTFFELDKLTIKQLQAKILVGYIYTFDSKTYEKVVFSNVINL